jgi:hypothetical protein
MEEHDLKQELEATLHARQELGRDLEPQLVERFVDKLDAEIDRRVKAQGVARRPRNPPAHGPHIAVPLGSLGIAIPLLGVAGGTAGWPGVLLVCIAIVLVNFFYYASHR